jgi:hypothetical protein
MKRGDRVILFQDGKLCRGMIGVVLANIRGHHVKVEYVFYDDDDVLKGAIATLRIVKHRTKVKKIHGNTELGYCTAEKLCNVWEWYKMVTAQRYDEDVKEEYWNYRQSIIDDIYKLIE